MPGMDIRMACAQTMRMRLTRRSALLLRHAGPARLACLSGTLWLSRERPACDTVLQAGQSLLLPDLQRVLASGLPEAELEIAAAMPTDTLMETCG